MTEVFTDFSEAFKEVEFTASVISCSKGHEIAVLRSFKGSEEQFSKDWMETFSGKCPRCQSELKFEVCHPDVYDQWASREDLRYMSGN